MKHIFAETEQTYPVELLFLIQICYTISAYWTVKCDMYSIYYHVNFIIT